MMAGRCATMNPKEGDTPNLLVSWIWGISVEGREYGIVDHLVQLRHRMEAVATAIIDAYGHVLAHLAKVANDLTKGNNRSGEGFYMHKDRMCNAFAEHHVLRRLVGIHGQKHRMAGPSTPNRINTLHTL